MGLIKCFECGTSVSEYADCCPKCGCPISKIKENANNTNVYLINFVNNHSIDLTGIDKKLTENELEDWGKFYNILTNDYNAPLWMCMTILDIFKFNNYKFPTNYQETYDAMCARNQERVNRNAPKCPTCKSTRIQKIGSLERGASIVGLGIFSKKINKTFKCNNCGYMW